jgi:DNA polymerase III sliding clamp (beta) subunit (PCNA family)
MQVTIKADTLTALLTGASQAMASPKDSKGIPFIGVTRLELADNTLTAIATDRHVLARGKATGLNGEGAGVANLSADTIKRVIQLLKPLRDRAVTLILGNSLTIQWETNALASSVPFDSVALDNYPKIDQLIPLKFEGLDTAITFNPAVMIKACKVTPDSIKWQFNGALKGAYGTATDTHGIEWDLLVMPLRIV